MALVPGRTKNYGTPGASAAWRIFLPRTQKVPPWLKGSSPTWDGGTYSPGMDNAHVAMYVFRAPPRGAMAIWEAHMWPWRSRWRSCAAGCRPTPPSSSSPAPPGWIRVPTPQGPCRVAVVAERAEAEAGGSPESAELLAPRSGSGALMGRSWGGVGVLRGY